MTDQRWPILSFEAEQAINETFHAYLQVVGKLPVRARPWVNHGWQLAMRVTPRGFRTYPVIAGDHEADLLVDCLASEIVLEASTGFRGAVRLRGQTVSELLGELEDLLGAAGVATDISGAPNEVVPAIPFAEDNREREWDTESIKRIHGAFRSANRVFEQFRTGFVGKSSPSHLFFGSFDLAVTRFSGRKAPLHPGGFPNLPDRVTREAYSHEVASAGFWLGGGGVDEAAFYAYGYPSPEGLSETELSTPGAIWRTDLSEFVLPYSAVREAPDPDGALMQFLEETYAAVADLADWDRAGLEIPTGALGAPYDVEAHR